MSPRVSALLRWPHRWQLGPTSWPVPPRAWGASRQRPLPPACSLASMPWGSLALPLCPVRTMLLTSDLGPSPSLPCFPGSLSCLPPHLFLYSTVGLCLCLSLSLSLSLFLSFCLWVSCVPTLPPPMSLELHASPCPPSFFLSLPLSSLPRGRWPCSDGCGTPELLYLGQLA